MPSAKPKVQALLDDDIYQKFQALCKKDKRSESNMGGLIITEYIENYEKEHGNLI